MLLTSVFFKLVGGRKKGKKHKNKFKFKLKVVEQHYNRVYIDKTSQKTNTSSSQVKVED